MNRSSIHRTSPEVRDHKQRFTASGLWRSAALLLGVLALCADAWAQTKLILWHSYRGAERKTLEKIVEGWNAKGGEATVELLAVPYDAFADRITAAIPRAKGPDLFIYAHDRLGGWAESQLIAPLEFWVDEEMREQFLPITIQAVTYKDSIYAVPLAAKSVVLFYNKKLVPEPPKTTDELIALGQKLTDKQKGTFGLVYENANFYYHAAWHLGFGGTVFDGSGNIAINTPPAVEALQFASDLDRKHGLMPQEITNVLVTTLFNQGKAAMVISGPWFRGEIESGLDYGVALLPQITPAGKPARPFMTSEGVVLSAKSQHEEAAFEFMKYLASPEVGVVLALEGQQTSALKVVWDDPTVKADPMLPVFRQQLDSAEPMPNGPEMLAVWTPATTAMSKVILGSTAPKKALDDAQAQISQSLGQKN
jgi:arabinogalactan oligomer/maltooligosaccharide transport system substrate-binding protein